MAFHKSSNHMPMSLSNFRLILIILIISVSSLSLVSSLEDCSPAIFNQSIGANLSSNCIKCKKELLMAISNNCAIISSGHSNATHNASIHSNNICTIINASINNTALINKSGQLVACRGGHVHQLHLTKLGLAGDQLQWISNLTQLRTLNLSQNSFHGSLPPALFSSLPYLTNLNLSSNQFNGTITNITSKSSRSNLQVIDLSHNQIHGPLQFNNLCKINPNLTSLHIRSNSMATSIASAELGSNSNLSLCKNLQELDMAGNRIVQENSASFASSSSSSAFLTQLQKVKTLKLLDLGSTGLNGSIPADFLTTLNNLQRLDLSYNHLSGLFDTQQKNLSAENPNLKYLNLSHNSLDLKITQSDIASYGGLSAFLPNRKCTGCSKPNPNLVKNNNNNTRSSPAPAPAMEMLSNSTQKTKPGTLTTRHHKSFKMAIMVAVPVACAIMVAAIVLCTMKLMKRRIKNPNPKTIMMTHSQVPEWTLQDLTHESRSTLDLESRSAWVSSYLKDLAGVPVVVFHKPLLKLTFADLMHATSSFDRTHEVGDGSSGLVYKCQLPGIVGVNGDIVALKLVTYDDFIVDSSISPTRKQGAMVCALTAMGDIKHENLVPLLGYCFMGNQTLLIYKFIEGESLEDLLVPLENQDPQKDKSWTWEMEDIDVPPTQSLPFHHPVEKSKLSCINWEDRVKIALGVARALAYLHDGCSPKEITHGSLNSTTIIISNEPTTHATVIEYGGGWGLRHNLRDGYVAPECLGSNTNESIHFTPKSDVYSLGVIMMELITGRPAIGNYSPTCTSLVSWIRLLMKEKQPLDALDPHLHPLHSPRSSSTLSFINLSYLCTTQIPSKRPSSRQVVGLLKDILNSALHET